MTLRDERPAPSAAFAAELDERADRGFAGDARDAGIPARGPRSRWERVVPEALRGIEPRRFVPAAGVACALLVALIVSLSVAGRDDGPPQRRRVGAARCDDERAAGRAARRLGGRRRRFGRTRGEARRARRRPEGGARRPDDDHGARLGPRAGQLVAGASRAVLRLARDREAQRSARREPDARDERRVASTTSRAACSASPTESAASFAARRSTAARRRRGVVRPRDPDGAASGRARAALAARLRALAQREQHRRHRAGDVSRATASWRSRPSAGRCCAGSPPRPRLDETARLRERLRVVDARLREASRQRAAPAPPTRLQQCLRRDRHRAPQGARRGGTWTPGDAARRRAADPRGHARRRASCARRAGTAAIAGLIAWPLVGRRAAAGAASGRSTRAPRPAA